MSMEEEPAEMRETDLSDVNGGGAAEVVVAWGSGVPSRELEAWALFILAMTRSLVPTKGDLA